MKLMLKNCWKLISLLYPFILAVDVVVIILTNNKDYLLPSQAVRSSFIVLLITALSWGSFFLITRDEYRSSYLCFLSVLLIFFYGYSYRLMNDLFHLEAHFKGNHLIVLGIWCLFLGVTSSGWMWNKIQNPRRFSTYFCAILVISLLPRFFSISLFVFRSTSASGNISIPSDLGHPDDLPVYSGSLPDIYYVILDSYGGKEVLLDKYYTDISSFIKFLYDKGFYIAEKSHSNYLQTELSLASSLNFNYLDQFAEMKNPQRQTLKELILHSKVRKYLERNGYMIIALASEDDYINLKDANVYYDEFVDINPFEEILLSVSVISTLDEFVNLGLPFQSYQTHRMWIQYTFDKVAEIPAIRGPKYVFVHIMMPHPPFVFDQDGTPVTPMQSFSMADGNRFPGSNEDYIKGYAQQVRFTNSKLQDMINVILEQSQQPPIIIIQGDHGPRRLINWDSLGKNCIKEAASIFNAYYFPNGGIPEIYPSISPVNTFRLIFNHYFDTNLGLLDDRSYFSDFFHPYDFTEITDIVDIDCQ